MTFEPVLMIWDIYDGPRTGLAQYKGQPHYFNCLWDEPNDNHSEIFSLSPVDDSFIHSATVQWKIYREWEFKFHTGLVELATHPDNRGINLEYDRLKDELNSRLKKLVELPNNFIPEFRVLPNQDDLPDNVLRNLEASWRKLN